MVSSRTMQSVGSKTSQYNSPGEALQNGVRSMALRPPVPDMSEITDTHTHTHGHTEYGY